MLALERPGYGAAMDAFFVDETDCIRRAVETQLASLYGVVRGGDLERREQRGVLALPTCPDATTEEGLAAFTHSRALWVARRGKRVVEHVRDTRTALYDTLSMRHCRAYAAGSVVVEREHDVAAAIRARVAIAQLRREISGPMRPLAMLLHLMVYAHEAVVNWVTQHGHTQGKGRCDSGSGEPQVGFGAALACAPLMGVSGVACGASETERPEPGVYCEICDSQCMGLQAGNDRRSWRESVCPGRRALERDIVQRNGQWAHEATVMASSTVVVPGELSVYSDVLGMYSEPVRKPKESTVNCGVHRTRQSLADVVDVRWHEHSGDDSTDTDADQEGLLLSVDDIVDIGKKFMLSRGIYCSHSSIVMDGDSRASGGGAAPVPAGTSPRQRHGDENKEAMLPLRIGPQGMAGQMVSVGSSGFFGSPKRTGKRAEKKETASVLYGVHGTGFDPASRVAVETTSCLPHRIGEHDGPLARRQVEDIVGKRVGKRRVGVQPHERGMIVTPLSAAALQPMSPLGSLHESQVLMTFSPSDALDESVASEVVGARIGRKTVRPVTSVGEKMMKSGGSMPQLGYACRRVGSGANLLPPFERSPSDTTMSQVTFGAHRGEKRSVYSSALGNMNAGRSASELGNRQREPLWVCEDDVFLGSSSSSLGVQGRRVQSQGRSSGGLSCSQINVGPFVQNDLVKGRCSSSARGNVWRRKDGGRRIGSPSKLPGRSGGRRGRSQQSSQRGTRAASGTQSLTSDIGLLGGRMVSARAKKSLGLGVRGHAQGHHAEQPTSGASASACPQLPPL